MAGSSVPICGCNFIVRFNHSVEVSFARISGIRKQNKFEYIKEGGRNDTPLMLILPNDEGVQLTFEKGVTRSADDFLSLKSTLTKRLVFGEIDVLDSARDKVKTYSFHSQGLIEYSLGDLNASSSEVLIQKMVLSTTGIIGL